MNLQELFTRDTTTVTAFMCRCSHQEVGYCEELMAAAKQDLTEHTGDLVTNSDFLTHAVRYLNDQHQAYIDSIHCDHWALVTAKRYDEENPYTVTVQCDSVEDGIAAILYAYTHPVPLPVAAGESGSVSDGDAGGV